jgi:hypothetical protein
MGVNGFIKKIRATFLKVLRFLSIIRGIFFGYISLKKKSGNRKKP